MSVVLVPSRYPICWPKGTLFSFVLMITNHMMLFVTNQVCMFLSIQLLRALSVYSSSKGRYSSLTITQGKGLDDQDSYFGEVLLKTEYNCKIVESLKYSVQN